MKSEGNSCRKNCGACCIAPSISSPLPLLPNGKKAGIACPHLDLNYSCSIFLSDLRPKICASLQPEAEMCCTNRQDALKYLIDLENATKP